MISKHLRDVLLKIPLRSKKGARRSYEWKWSILVVLDMILKSFFGVEGHRRQQSTSKGRRREEDTDDVKKFRFMQEKFKDLRRGSKMCAIFSCIWSMGKPRTKKL